MLSLFLFLHHHLSLAFLDCLFFFLVLFYTGNSNRSFQHYTASQKHKLTAAITTWVDKVTLMMTTTMTTMMMTVWYGQWQGWWQQYKTITRIATKEYFIHYSKHNLGNRQTGMSTAAFCFLVIVAHWYSFRKLSFTFVLHYHAGSSIITCSYKKKVWLLV